MKFQSKHPPIPEPGTVAPPDAATPVTASPWWTTRQLANHLQLSASTVTRLLEAGTILGKKIGGQWRIHQSAIDEYLADGIPKPRQSHKPDMSIFEAATKYV